MIDFQSFSNLSLFCERYIALHACAPDNRSNHIKVELLSSFGAVLLLSKRSSSYCKRLSFICKIFSWPLFNFSSDFYALDFLSFA